MVNSVLKKGKSAIPSASDIAKLFAGNFPMNSNLVDSGFSLPAVPSRTKWKLCNVYVSPKLVGRSHLQSLYLLAKNYHPFSLFSMIREIFEKLVNNRHVDHLQKCGLFCDSQYGFRSSASTVSG